MLKFLIFFAPTKSSINFVWMNPKLKKIFSWVIVYPLMIILCFEIALRILGYGGYHNENYSISAEPANAFVGDARYGIKLNPGTYEITLNNKVSFSTTHDQNNRRIVSDESYQDADIIFLGCSFTYGYGVDNDECFPSLIQQELSSEVVSNFGVPGYGTIQSLLQLQEYLKEHSPSLVLLNFSSLHFMRNTLSQEFRSNLRIGYRHSSKDVDTRLEKARFPYMRECGTEVKYVSWKEMYTNWPGRDWSASVNWMQSLIDRYKDEGLNSLKVSACIIEEMNVICREKGVGFGIVFLDSTPEVNQLKEMLEGISTLDMKFDFKSSKYTNLPYDSHPNQKGNKLIASRIIPFIDDLISNE
tara:strand:+ start:178973 stop:180043 length:1071 start_codon:yes stop_codon:yes gene_type:complete